jgi:hypothetical protein
MPEYDATNYPKPMTDDLTDAEVGRDSGPTMARWPSSNVLPDRYAGPPPSREFETNSARVLVATPVPAVPPPADAPAPMESIAPPPGHTAQPQS